MTCNYKNSAGTDLDSLFYTNNGNAGAIGFTVSNGQDLGNRYTNASKLNQTIGYKNSAGTDIGYLRGNIAAPTISGLGISLYAGTTNGNHDYEGGSGESTYWVTCRGTNPVYKITFSTGNSPTSMSIKIQIYGDHIDHQTVYSAKDRSSALAGGCSAVSGHDASSTFGAYNNSWRDYHTYSWSSVSTTKYIAMAVRGVYNCETPLSVRVIVTVSNSAGSASATSGSITARNGC